MTVEQLQNQLNEYEKDIALLEAVKAQVQHELSLLDASYEEDEDEEEYELPLLIESGWYLVITALSMIINIMFIIESVHNV